MKHTVVPSGIYYGWFVVATAFFVSLVTVGARIGFGVFVLPMSEDFDWNRSTISLAASIGFLVSGLSQPFLGRIYDRVGARRLVLISLAVLGVATMLLALTTHILYLILIFGVVLSLAMSGGSLNILALVVPKWFRRRRATVVAITAAGASVGGLVLVPFASYLVEIAGWRATWAVLGLLVLLLALPLVFILLKEHPAEMGLLPDGDTESSLEMARRPQPLVRGPLEVEYWLHSFRSRPMWQLSGAYFVCGFTTAIISAHFVPNAIERGFSPSTAATAFGLMAGLNAVGVLVAGALGDRFGRKNFLGLVYAMRACGYAALLLAPDSVGLWAFAAITGFSWLATVPLTTSLTADVYGLKNLGVLTGVAYAVHNVGGAIGIQLGGIMRDLTGSYDLPFTVAALLLVAASLTAFSIQEKRFSSRYQVASGAPLPHPASLP